MKPFLMLLSMLILTSCSLKTNKRLSDKETINILLESSSNTLLK